MLLKRLDAAKDCIAGGVGASFPELFSIQKNQRKIYLIPEKDYTTLPPSDLHKRLTRFPSTFEGSGASRGDMIPCSSVGRASGC